MSDQPTTHRVRGFDCSNPRIRTSIPKRERFYPAHSWFLPRHSPALSELEGSLACPEQSRRATRPGSQGLYLQTLPKKVSNRPIPKLESTPTHRKQTPAPRSNRPIFRNSLPSPGPSRVPLGTAEGSPGWFGGICRTQSREQANEKRPAASAAHTFGALPSAALLARAQEDRSRISRPGEPHGEQRAKGEEKSNRDNPKIKNRRNQRQTNDIPKANRDKNSTRVSGFVPRPRDANPDRRKASITMTD